MTLTNEGLGVVMKKILFIQIMFLFCFPIGASGAKYVFISSEFAGISEYNEAGEPSGLGVDIIGKVAEDLDIRITIKIYPFNRMMFLIQDKSVDAAFGVYKKPDREEFMDYIDVSFFDDSYLFYTNHSTRLSWNGEMSSFPRDKVFCWVRGWSYFGELYKIKNQIRLQENSSLEGCLKMLVGKRFDLMAGPIRDIVPLIKKRGYGKRLKLISKVKGLEGNYIAFPKDHLPLLQKQVKQSLIGILKSNWYLGKLRQYNLDEAVIE